MDFSSRLAFLTFPLATAGLALTATAGQAAAERTQLKRVCSQRVETGTLVPARKCRKVPVDSEVAQSENASGRPVQGSSPITQDLTIVTDGIAAER